MYETILQIGGRTGGRSHGGKAHSEEGVGAGEPQRHGKVPIRLIEYVNVVILCRFGPRSSKT
jgi:hypothetical protein